MAYKNIHIKGVTLIPSTGGFAYSTTPTVRVFDGTPQDSENVHTNTGKTDVQVALDQLFARYPECHTVSLVISWFADDLRCEYASIHPKIGLSDEQREGSVWTPIDWTVAGLSASQVVSTSERDGNNVYGSTPSDVSVKEIIAEVKKRGKKIVFYPFILMDVPLGNTLPDPWNPSSYQPINPWRGRVTCFPAPGVAGSPDGTAEAGRQMELFFNQEWGFKRFIMHYAQLCKEAGGIDYFLIGSEMVGVTQVRSARSTYTAVHNLKELAAGVKNLLPLAEVGYAADWTEYHSRQYSNGDLFFHLDDLWSDPNIDFIGIDNYFPIADVRSTDDPSLIYDIDYLKSNIEGGELYDWYYVDRANNVKAAITDGAYNKPWVYRQKDIRNWWSNPHINRQESVETTQTSWVPGSKPVWFTEYGCSCTNRGPNQPNVFYDPLSSESSFPYFSTGARDDNAQRCYLIATYDYWKEHGGDMISTDHMIVWTWDSRPFPQFPQLTNIWGDYVNYPTGHWLMGRTYTTGAAMAKNYVYEMEKGWSFDGNYIPHFLELNWFFGDAPISYHNIQKIRIHGMTKGTANLDVSMAGMQTEYDSDYMDSQRIDLETKSGYVEEDFVPSTNYADYAVRGISVQMKFEGHNEDITKPEPSHVIQVLVTQGTGADTGARSN